MKIKSFRIKNYRSINDSGVCYLSGDNITILAGKNESGKTAILEALEDFNTEREIREEAIPYHRKEAMPEISVTFEVDKKSLRQIYKEIKFMPGTVDAVKLEIIKKYPNEYSISGETVKGLHIRDEKLLDKKKKEIKEIYADIERIYVSFPQIGGILPVTNFDDIPKFKSELEDLRNQTVNNWGVISDISKRNRLEGGFEEIIKKIIEMHDLLTIQEVFTEKIKELIPNFILFVSFEDIFPSEVALDQAADNELIKDLDIISELNLELIRSGSMAAKTKHKEQLNVRLKEDYKKFWTQDLTNLHMEWDSDKLCFFIKEDEDFYPPNLRSKGKQWHLAFYVKVAARARENVPNIVLIDEPGLFLHAKAQEDVLKRLEDSAKDAPVIFSTHSPYLIKIDKLNRIRLISRTTKKGTLLSNKIHKGADKETLTPIITAIGLDLSMGLDIAKDNNVILEGITDYYYLSAFKELLNFSFDKEVHLIPSVGADKFNFLVPLMIGWGLNYCCVLDNDDKGRRIEKKLLEDFEHIGVKTKLVGKSKGEEIEDLFEREDFIKYVLNENSNEVVTDKKNSEIIKQRDKNYDKVLLSKLFLEKIKNGAISLSEDTTGNFRDLLEEINRLMFPKI